MAPIPPDPRPEWLADAPLFQAWERFASADVAPFTIPGHKRARHRLGPDLGRLLDADVPLYGGADTVKLTAGVLTDAQRRAAELWGADRCWFSTGGSTQANLALCLSLGAPGDEVLVTRTAHRSVLSGLVLAGLRPIWLPVATDPRTGSPRPVTPDQVDRALRASPRAVAVLSTEPNYHGVLAEVSALADVAHRHGAALVVDQAWGAHLGFAPGLPPHALAAGADAMVTSAHKALPAFSQAALVLVRTERLDPARVDRAVEASATTSPSAAILASIDAARALLASPQGADQLLRVSDQVARARDRLRAAGLLVPGPEDHPPGRFDPLKLVVHFAGAGRDGLAAEQTLLADGVPVEMVDRDTLVAQVGLVDDETSLGRLVDGILTSMTGPAGPPREVHTRQPPLPPQRLLPRAAFFADTAVVDRSHAVGRVSAELVAPYPPGIPLLVPGEEITAATLDALDTALSAGNRIAYAADPSLATLQVVADPG